MLYMERVHNEKMISAFEILKPKTIRINDLLTFAFIQTIVDRLSCLERFLPPIGVTIYLFSIKV